MGAWTRCTGRVSVLYFYRNTHRVPNKNSSLCIYAKLWHAVLGVNMKTHRCWRDVATVEREVGNIKRKFIRLSYSLVNSFPLPSNLSEGQNMRLTSQCLLYPLSQVLYDICHVLNPWNNYDNMSPITGNWIDRF